MVLKKTFIYRTMGNSKITKNATVDYLIAAYYRENVVQRIREYAWIKPMLDTRTSNPYCAIDEILYPYCGAIDFKQYTPSRSLKYV